MLRGRASHIRRASDEGCPYRCDKTGMTEVFAVAWIILICSGLLEAGWATMLPRTEGFSRLVPSAAFLVLLAASMYGLAVATRDIPIGTGYAVWVGIGAVGTLLADVVLSGERIPPAQVIAVMFLIGSIIAVKATAAA